MEPKSHDELISPFLERVKLENLLQLIHVQKNDIPENLLGIWNRFSIVLMVATK
jgi:hypothetical protein